MKKIALFTLLLAAGLVCSCSKDTTSDPISGEGSVSLHITAGTRAASDYDPLDYCSIDLLSSEGVIRRYESIAEIPEQIWLLAGNYTIEVEAGDHSNASFTNKTYAGTQPFEVTAGQSTPVEVNCKIQNAMVEIVFDPSIAAMMFLYGAGVCIGDNYDDGLVNKGLGLNYETKSQTGYFLMPEGQTQLTCYFFGLDAAAFQEHEDSHTIEDVVPGNKYTITYRWSPDAGGMIDFTLAVDTATEDFNDTIIFVPGDAIDIQGDGFDLSEPQSYTAGSKRLLLTAEAELGQLALQVDSERIDLLGTLPAGITVENPAELQYAVTLGEDFFASLCGGDHLFTVMASSSAEGNLSTASFTVSTQGIVPVDASAIDLWKNTATLKARVFESGETITISLREADGSWRDYPATDDGDGYYSVSVAPRWVASQNPAGLTTYTIAEQTGVLPGRTYECKASIGGTPYGASTTFSTVVSQPIPNGDMEDGNISAYTYPNTEAPFWGSGNNYFTPSLCTQGTFAGMGGSHCTFLKATQMMGVLAAGNFFTGTFTREDMGGHVDFGQDYDWVARPAGLKLKYHAKVGTVNLTKHTGAGLESGNQDISAIYVAVIDWSSRHRVSSSTTSCSGVWSCDQVTSLDEGAIIGYGILYINESTSGEEMIETTIPMQYYDTEARPEGTYKIVISAATSLYGDYMTGCSSNELYLDDLEWAY